MKLYTSRTISVTSLLVGIITSNENSYATAKLQSRHLKGEKVIINEKKVAEIKYYYYFEPVKGAGANYEKNGYDSSASSSEFSKGSVKYSYKDSSYVIQNQAISGGAKSGKSTSHTGKGSKSSVYNGSYSGKGFKSMKSSKSSKSSKSAKASLTFAYGNSSSGTGPSSKYSETYTSTTKKNGTAPSPSEFMGKADDTLTSPTKKDDGAALPTAKKDGVAPAPVPPTSTAGKKDDSAALPTAKKDGVAPAPAPPTSTAGKKDDGAALPTAKKDGVAPAPAPPTSTAGKKDDGAALPTAKKDGVAPAPAPPTSTAGKKDDTISPKGSDPGKDAAKKSSSVTSFSYAMTVPKSTKKDEISKSAKKLEGDIYSHISTRFRGRSLRHSRKLIDEFTAKEPKLESFTCDGSACDAEVSSSFEVSTTGDLSSAICSMLESIITYMSSFNPNDIDGILKLTFLGSNFSGTCSNLPLLNTFSEYRNNNKSPVWWVVLIVIPVVFLLSYLLICRKRKGFTTVKGSDSTDDDASQLKDENDRIRNASVNVHSCNSILCLSCKRGKSVTWSKIESESK